MTDYPFVPSDVALYHRTLSAADSLIDEPTWDDLLLPAYSAELARGTSIFGQQELHRRLHAQQGAAAGRVRALLADDSARRRLEAACLPLRDADREISATLFGPALPPLPRWLPLLKCLPLLFCAAFAGALVLGWLSLWGLAVLLALGLCAVQMRHYEAVQEWARVLHSTQLMLRVHTLLDGPLVEELRADAPQAGRLNWRMSRSLLMQVPLFSDYGEWFFLQNVVHFFTSREAARQHIALLRSSFTRVAALDADLALARHLHAAPVHCWAERGDTVVLDGMVHPLLADAMPLTFSMAQQGIFVSGRNGIGKSTLLRAVGLNLVTARAFGFCYAAHAVTPLLPVYASMQNEDALASGESFYMAELRRGQELLALAAQRPAVFLVDEIFRGTNYLESVSAAAAVLHTLAARGRLVVASHHLVLAALLAEQLQAWCVSRTADGWELAPGLLQDTNGIALLAERGFAADIVSRANRVHAWLGQYLAHPDAGLPTLAP